MLIRGHSLRTRPKLVVCYAAEDLQEHLLVDVEEQESEDKKLKFRVRELNRVSDGGVGILRGVSVDIPKGSVVGVIGPSGSGKSTFLKALNRLWEPPSGTVFFYGHDICALDVLALRRRVGMLFQLPVLFEGMGQMVPLHLLHRHCIKLRYYKT